MSDRRGSHHTLCVFLALNEPERRVVFQTRKLCKDVICFFVIRAIIISLIAFEFTVTCARRSFVQLLY